ncbi:amino acid adenylation domain-containing protein [Paenibacillus marchantiae]|uniref:non-ribosomal peptide synthetase n=1 Tax=Paenibacillus marchantiae TaxID=3026433 RepID=UPI00237AB9B1|nr:non-ribosomal peptide synthetase [Paenibacillus marchantiae]WDQ32174.1 amino acid adenylation domain-containing protein [Paenibacillus marchantiae]
MPNTVEGYQLSPQQKRIWSLSENGADSDYKSQFTLLLDGSVNIQYLKQAFTMLLNKHEIFRTRFHKIMGLNYPLQVTNDELLFNWEESKLEGDTSNHTSYLNLLIKERWKKGIDTSGNIFIDAFFLNVNDTTNYLIITFSALLADNNIDLVIKELKAAYSHLIGNAMMYEHNEEIPYSVLSAWFNELDESDNAREGKQYWKSNIESYKLNQKLPFSERSFKEYKPEILKYKLGFDQVYNLDKISKDSNVKLETIFLALWQVTLFRLIRESPTIGLNVLGRSDEELEHVIGLLDRYVPFKIEFDENINFIEYLNQIENGINDINIWQDTFSWEDLELSHEYFSFGIDFNIISDLGSSVDGLNFRLFDQIACLERFDLKLSVLRIQEDIELKLYYDSTSLDEDYVKQILTHFLNVMAAIENYSEIKLSKINLFDDVGTQTLLEKGGNGKSFPFIPIHELFEKKVEENPNKIAVVCEDLSISYIVLNQRANKLASGLTKLGIEAGSIVGISMERSIDMVISMLAILKIGAAYLPLDKDYPIDRLSFMINDSGVKLIITKTDTATKFNMLNSEMLYIDTFDWSSMELSNENINKYINPEFTAYVIYTSGSTGKPKGVLIPHRAISNQMQWIQDQFPMFESDKLLQKTSFSFDASVWEFYAPLINGVELVMGAPDIHLDPAAMISEIIKHKISNLQVVPAMLDLLVSQEEFSDCLSLKRIFVGGEIFISSLAQKVFDKLPNIQLINLYGPSECCINSLFWELDKESTEMKPIPIGRPVASTKMYILDKHMNLAPYGTPGELYIGGIGLANGYLNNSELSNKKFIDNPFESNQIIYKTGDLVEYQKDGTVKFIGRVDNQVKLRGFRIELEEIEALLNNHNSVNKAIVNVMQDNNGIKKLVAYISCDRSNYSEKELRELLGDKLPEYMLPSAYIYTEAFPLTSNGKIDRKNLPDPEISMLFTSENFIEPKTLTEEIVAGIWCKLLDVDKVGIENNFFEIGGHSLIATQVVARIRDILKVNIPLRTIFNSPTIKKISEVIDSYLTNNNLNDNEFNISAVSREESIPLSFAQQRLWFIEQLEPNSPLYNMIDAIQLEGKLNIDALERAINLLLERHEILRTTFDVKNGIPEQLISQKVQIKLQSTNLNSYSDHEIDEKTKELINEEGRTSFNLTKGPLIRASLLILSDEKYILLLTTHHIINDGWSRGIIIREIGEYYRSYIENKTPKLPNLPLQYADFSLWQRKWMKNEVLESQLSYWKNKLDGDLPVLQLPTDYARSHRPTFKGALYQSPLSLETKDELNKLSQREGTSLFMTLFASFNVLLNRYTGQEDILIGSAIANRNYNQIENLIGFFVNTLGLRTDLSGDPTFKDLLSRVREISLGAYANQDIPFDKVVEEIQPNRDLSHSPMFRVMFALQNLPLSDLELTNINLSPITVDNGTSKFDITLSITECPDGLIGEWEYSTELFKPDTIERMASQFEFLIGEILENPNQKISEYTLINKYEQAQILQKWNRTEVDYPKDKGIDSLFLEMVGLYGDKIACEFNNSAISYTELNNSANEVAQKLNNLGVTSESLVGVVMDKSIELIISLLAVIKLGAAYVPIDPNYPKDRINYILNDTKLNVVLTQKNYKDDWSKLVQHVINLNKDELCLDDCSHKVMLLNVTENHKAYVMYTSGSTGLPKGVVITHNNIIRLVKSNDYVDFNEKQTFIQSSPVTFDASTFEIWGALLNGARLVIPSHSRYSLEELSNLIVDKNVSVMFMTTALFNQMVDGHLSKNNKLKHLLVGGEAMSIKALEQGYSLLRNCKLTNVYGPTEGTTFTTFFPITDLLFNRSVPIGAPIANTTAYVMDEQRRILPIGVSGELYIGGDGVALGYLNNDELTSQVFFEHQHLDGRIEKLYRTGDLVRRLSDGNIEFVGRVDDQIKIRGYRIELGEIETTIRKFDAIKDSVVSVHVDQNGEKQLIAYIIPEKENEESGLIVENNQTVNDWEMIFDDYFYSQEAVTQDETFNTIGWNSNFTGKPIDLKEMRLWLNNTVQQIQSLNPSRVLEIGCGTGMILYRIAPSTNNYLGLDISRGVIEELEKSLLNKPEYNMVKLFHNAAHDFSKIQQSFDTVILNSVVQYFPSREYLTEVLGNAIKVISDEGSIFIGDVRSYSLLDTFQFAVELYKAKDDMSSTDLIDRICERNEMENELVISPEYFYQLQNDYPQITGVKVTLKRGDYTNELSQFRYDVTLLINKNVIRIEPQEVLEWDNRTTDLFDIIESLQKEEIETLRLNKVPDLRVLREVETKKRFDNADLSEIKTIGELKQIAKDISIDEAVNPAKLFDLESSTNYVVEISFSQNIGYFDVIFINKSRMNNISSPIIWGDNRNDFDYSQKLTTYPKKIKDNYDLISKSRSYLQVALPEYMLPTHFIVMDKFPINSNGKVDKKSLPLPYKSRTFIQNYVPPRTDTEQMLCNIWEEVLDIRPIGIYDDFFELGGHSLLATQIISRLRNEYDLGISLHSIFEYSSIELLSQHVEHIILEEFHVSNEKE